MGPQAVRLVFHFGLKINLRVWALQELRQCQRFAFRRQGTKWSFFFQGGLARSGQGRHFSGEAWHKDTAPLAFLLPALAQLLGMVGLLPSQASAGMFGPFLVPVPPMTCPLYQCLFLSSVRTKNVCGLVARGPLNSFGCQGLLLPPPKKTNTWLLLGTILHFCFS